ncbi:TIGR02391 family protein [Modestobacter sp. SYSU DS0657]
MDGPAGRPRRPGSHELGVRRQGQYRLGATDAEREGWHLLARGIAMALRNPAAHRIVNRSDHRLFAFGVIGASSLLLTQLRFDHASHFIDLSPAHPDEAPADAAAVTE